MYITRDFYIETPLSQPDFAKWDNSGSNEQEANDTPWRDSDNYYSCPYLVAMVPLFRSSCLRHWGSSFLASSFVEKAFSTIRPNSAPTTIAAMEDSSTTPVADIVVAYKRSLLIREVSSIGQPIQETSGMGWAITR
ncbi:hypothetical protein L873DRAFT_1790478 [Choiromyces venosus 120613-1]|uniref:Uncharacterized protein n=1 Tax=Choiromyces venosus 120613-1 TaxID=1336337 RepID=A0A3N4JIR1_9PEZI|nr:hypothetical protein L873DRAFT_1790478 [Choiromyces venosus 120613-1]